MRLHKDDIEAIVNQLFDKIEARQQELEKEFRDEMREDSIKVNEISYEMLKEEIVKGAKEIPALTDKDKLNMRVEYLVKAKDNAILNERYEEISEISTEIDRLKNEIDKLDE